MIVASRFYRVVYKPILLNKFTWNKFYLEGIGNISALEALNASKLNTIILNDILHFLGPIGFEKIMSVSNKLINLLLSGSVVTYLVLNSWTLFLVVVLNWIPRNRYQLASRRLLSWLTSWLLVGIIKGKTKQVLSIVINYPSFINYYRRHGRYD